MNKKSILGLAAGFLLASQVVSAASLDKAALLRRHGLAAHAKLELIEVIFSDAGDAAKAEAHYVLGSIAFEENSVTAALETWVELLQRYPDSKQAGLVEDRVQELAEIAGETSKSTLDNVVAQSYLRHADFWSERKEEILRIDSSWIPNVEAAAKWYDRVIAEFPRSPASRRAYEGKLRAILGWKDPGQYGEAHGVQGNFARYIPQLEATFAAFERDHPDAGTLQAFRYQIAQAYWAKKHWVKAREWLGIIIAKSGDGDSFYRDLAERRLAKLEY